MDHLIDKSRGTGDHDVGARLLLQMPDPLNTIHCRSHPERTGEQLARIVAFFNKPVGLLEDGQFRQTDIPLGKLDPLFLAKIP